MPTMTLKYGCLAKSCWMRFLLPRCWCGTARKVLKVLNGKCRALSLTKNSGHMLTGYLGFYLSLTLRSHSRENVRLNRRRGGRSVRITSRSSPLRKTTQSRIMLKVIGNTDGIKGAKGVSGWIPMIIDWINQLKHQSPWTSQPFLTLRAKPFKTYC